MAYSTARLTVAIDGANEDITHWQLHDGDPGAGGTANVAAEVAARVAAAFTGATAGEEELLVTFPITGAGGPYTHVTAWNALTSGTYQATAALTPQESFAGAGELAVTVTATAANG